MTYKNFIQFDNSFPLKYFLLPVFKKKIVQIGRFPGDIFYFEIRGRGRLAQNETELIVENCQLAQITFIKLQLLKTAE